MGNWTFTFSFLFYIFSCRGTENRFKNCSFSSKIIYKNYRIYVIDSQILCFVQWYLSSLYRVAALFLFFARYICPLNFMILFNKNDKIVYFLCHQNKVLINCLVRSRSDAMVILIHYAQYKQVETSIRWTTEEKKMIELQPIWRIFLFGESIWRQPLLL